MPAKYHPVSPSLWDRTMRSLTGPAKVVRLYLLTCPVRVSEGLFRVPLGHVVHDTGLRPEHVDQALAELEAAGLVSYDFDVEVALDRTALRFTPLRNGVDQDGQVKPDNRIPGAVRQFEQVPETHLKVAFYALALRHSPHLADALARRFPALLRTPDEEAPSEPLGSPSEGASRARARAWAREEAREEVETGIGCQVSGCPSPAAWRLSDGGVVCEAHQGATFGAATPMDESP